MGWGGASAAFCLCWDAEAGCVQNKLSFVDAHGRMRVLVPDTRWPLAALIIAVLDLFLWFPLSHRFRVYPKFAMVKLPFAVFAWVLLGAAIACTRPEDAGAAALWGACVGATVYGVFNATEASIRADWRRFSTVACDVLWGTVVCAVAAVTSYAVAAHSTLTAIVASAVASVLLVALSCALIILDGAPLP